jgi:membrane protein
VGKVLERIRQVPAVRFWRRFTAAGPGVLASAIAFNLFFALVPAAVASIAAASVFGEDQEAKQQTVDYLERALPTETAEFIANALGDAWETGAGAQGIVVAVGLAVSLWAGSRGVMTVMRVLARIEQVEDPRRWWHRRLLAIGLTLGAGGTLLVSSVLIVAGSSIAGRLEDLTDLDWLVSAWERLSFPLGTIGLLAFLMALYRWAPPKRLPGFWIAAVLAAIGMIAASLGFRYYVENSGNLGGTFAAFGAFAVFLLWLYLMSYVIILSAAIGTSVARSWTARRMNGRDAEEMSLGLETMESEIAGTRPERTGDLGRLKV